MNMLARFMTCSILICLLQGCQCAMHVTIANQTDAQLLADISMPDEGYGLFQSHCQFSVLLEPGQTWNSQQTSRRDRIELSTGPHDVLLVRLINLDEQGWPNAVYTISHSDVAIVTVTGSWQTLQVAAVDAQGNDLEVWHAQHRDWFGDARPRMETVP